MKKEELFEEVKKIMTRLKFRIYEEKKAQKNLRLFLSIYKT